MSLLIDKPSALSATERAMIVCDYLRQYCHERDKAIRSDDLCKELLLPDAKRLNYIVVRNAVHYLRVNEHPINALTSVGYWWSERPDDIRDTISELTGRVRGICAAIDGLSRILARLEGSSQGELFR